MTTTANFNKELVRRYYEAATGDLSQMDQIVTASFVDHHFPPTLPPGPEGVKQFFTNVLGSVFGDMRIEHYDMAAEEDKVYCYFALHAAHVSEFAGIAPSGQELVIPAISHFRVVDGKLAEGWEIFDSGALLQQMQAKLAGQGA
jgi:predicted ester cyclase